MGDDVHAGFGDVGDGEGAVDGQGDVHPREMGDDVHAGFGDVGDGEGAVDGQGDVGDEADPVGGGPLERIERRFVQPADAGIMGGGPARRGRRGSSPGVALDRMPLGEEALVQFYLTELRVAVGQSARMAGRQAVAGAVFHGARALVILEAYDPIVTWTEYKGGKKFGSVQLRR